MSALGQKRTLRWSTVMSALPPKADIAQHGGNVRFVPKADMGSYAVSRKRRIRSCPEAASERFLFSLALYRQVDDRETLSAECALWQG
jgi:hypothetical protein